MKLTKRSFFIGCAAAALSAVGAGAQAGVTIRDFETNTFDGLNISGNSPRIQSTVRRAGRYGMKSYLDRYKSRNSYRTEVRVLAPDPVYGKEYWYGFGIYLPAGYQADPVWEILAQWHAHRDVGEGSMPPVIALNTTGGRWSVVNRWTPRRIGDKAALGSRTIDMGKYATGRWTDFVFRVKWSYGSDGIFEVWKDGRKVASVRGPNCYNDARMPYFKMGIYKGWKSGDPVGKVNWRIVYHDQFRMVGPGGSYAQVAPGATNAPSAPTAPVIE